MKKLTGSDIIVLLRASAKDEAVIAEARELSKDDFMSEDLIVDCFFQNYKQGFASVNLDCSNKEALASVADNLQTIKQEVSSYGLRKAHNLIQNIRNANNEAVLLDNQVNDFKPENGISAQIKAAQLVSFLSKYIDGKNSRDILALAVNNIHAGKLKDASEEIREVFSSIHPDKLVKTAYSTMRNLFGEAYQMCPKGIYVSGNAVPMPVGNCVDYCVDVRVNRDGSVGCNYVKWLNENLITQSQALNFPDHIHDKIHDEQETMNLETGQRTKFKMSDQDSQDMRVIRDEELTKESGKEGWEAQLSKLHNKPVEPVKNVEPIATDSALELLLKNTRDVFDDEDLDVLEVQLRESLGQ